ncbi:unnamed protein product, partial [Polarella glacialis]
VFLNDVPAHDGGGFLHFPKLGLRVLPKAGSAVLWRNLRPSGEPDPDSLHEGEPPFASEKLAMNVWVADRPFTLAAIQAWRERAQREQARPRSCGLVELD